MPNYFTNVAPVTLKLRHVSMRSDTVTVEPGGLYCQSDRAVVAFMLGLSGHREARDPSNAWGSLAITQTPAGGRLVYLLADIRRSGDLADNLAGAFFHALSGLGVDALGRQARGERPTSFSEQYFVNEQNQRTAKPVGEWLTDRWRRLRPDTPNGYVNLGTRQPAWRGALVASAKVPLVPVG